MLNFSPPSSILEEPEQPKTVATKTSWKQHTAELFEPALPYIVTGWLVGVFGLSVWHLGGWAQLQRLRRKMVRQVNASLQGRLKELVQKLGVNRAVQLLESALVEVPTVVGWLRPVILLPASALTGLSVEQLDAMLAHELAHIKRFDYLVNMLQTVVEILGFYHPAVWWVSHKIRAERENCCDDLAVSISGDRVRYARALTLMEEIRASRGELAVAASGSSLFTRISRLVGKEPRGSRDGWIPSAIAILLIIAMVIPTTVALTARAETKAAAERQDKLTESLHEAAATGNIDQLKTLISKGVNANAKNQYGDTPLHVAAEAGHTNVAELLIAKGAAIDVKNNWAMTPLHYARNKNVAELLIAKGANLNAREANDRTPLHFAANNERMDVAEILLAKGANVNAKSTDDVWMGCLTPLHCAVESGYTKIVGLFIGKGADVNAKKSDGETPLHIACKRGYKDVVELLVAKGADMNAKDSKGQTALSSAKEQGYTEIVELLRKHGAKE